MENRLIIDIGNTQAKLAAFSDDELLEVEYTDNLSLSALSSFCQKHAFACAILSSVIDLSEEAQETLQNLSFPLLRLTHETPLPIRNLYETPQTLGYDRIAAVVGAISLKPGVPLLVIDAGTCITYEFVDAAGAYHGGNISPGLQMRLKALHHFTGKLPLVEAEGRTMPLGKTTETAIRAGVMKGLEYEIRGYIEHLILKYPELLVFLTGGDEFSFDTNLKSRIFADKFLVLKGLNRILDFNR